MGEGSISEKIGDVLSELGYRGDYSRVTANGFVKQASVMSCLEKLGLTSEKMAEYIRGMKAAAGENKWQDLTLSL